MSEIKNHNMRDYRAELLMLAQDDGPFTTQELLREIILGMSMTEAEETHRFIVRLWELNDTNQGG